MTRAIGDSGSASTLTLGSSRSLAPSGTQLGSLLLPSVRCAGETKRPAHASGIAAATACEMCPAAISPALMRPAETGMLEALDPQLQPSLSLAPGHTQFE